MFYTKIKNNSNTSDGTPDDSLIKGGYKNMYVEDSVITCIYEYCEK